jgi:predicted metal-binding membrane protein
MRAASDQRIFMPVAIALIGLAWVVLFAWGTSPWGAYLSHDQLEDATLAPDPRFAALVAGWVLMTLAMMLPTSLPLVSMFQRMTSRRKDGTRLVALLVCGYLVVWLLFGVLAHVLDLGIHQLVSRSPALADQSWLIGASIVFVAGVYQFTPLKYHCLDACRSPLSFISARWSGASHGQQAFRLGVDHGAFCVGCCWSLMLLMFAVGVGNVGWMLMLGAVMAIEKNLPWGRQLSAPLGGLLIGLGVLLIISGSMA